MKEHFFDYATTINNLNSGQLTQFTGANQSNLVKEVSDDKADAFQTSYSNLNNVSNNYNVAQFYAKQSKKFTDVVTGLGNQGANNLAIADQNIALNTRNAEIKEWYFNNKLDTLFVFQLIFLSLCLLAFIAYMMKLGFFGSGVFGMLVGLIIISMILVIANRAVYTEKVRDKRYWTKRGFSSVGDTLPGVNKRCN